MKTTRGSPCSGSPPTGSLRFFRRRARRRFLLCFLAAAYLLCPVAQAALGDESGELPVTPGPGFARDPSPALSSGVDAEGVPGKGNEARTPRSGPFFYDFRFQLQISGSMTMVTSTRYCRSEDLRLRLAANRGPDGWHFHSLGLAAGEDTLNFGIGEGPKKHQRYLLFDARPSPERRRAARERLLRLEEDSGCGLDEAADGEGSGKEGFFNDYLWEDPRGAFQFLVSPAGEIVHVTDHTRVSVLSQEGGKRAKPRFFETLKYAMLAVPPLMDSVPSPSASMAPVFWEMACGPVYQGLAELVKNVYGRKMTIMRPETLAEQRLRYRGEFLPGASILLVLAETGPLGSAEIRVSGLKGSLGIEGLRREVYFDTRGQRVLQEVLEISFRIRRDKRVFPVLGDTNRVRLSLVDESFAGRADRGAVVDAAENCVSGEARHER